MIRGRWHPQKSTNSRRAFARCRSFSKRTVHTWTTFHSSRCFDGCSICRDSFELRSRIITYHKCVPFVSRRRGCRGNFSWIELTFLVSNTVRGYGFVELLISWKLRENGTRTVAREDSVLSHCILRNMNYGSICWSVLFVRFLNERIILKISNYSKFIMLF